MTSSEEDEDKILARVRSITPQSGKLKFPMGYFYHTFCGLVRRSKNGEVNHQDLIDSLNNSYEWKRSEDIIGEALRQNLIEQLKEGVYIRKPLQWEELLKANLFKENVL